MQDVDAVISEAALSEDADVLLEGVSVASRIAAIAILMGLNAGYAALASACLSTVFSGP